MDELLEKEFTEQAIQFHLIPSEKFKTVNFVVKFRAALHKDVITKRALLPYILEKGTKNYPSEKLLMRRLDELYGAVLHIDGAKKGNYHVLTFRLEVANEKYLRNEASMTKAALELLHEVIFDPFTIQDAFSEKVVEREKVTLKNRINAIQDDKMAYANMRLVDHMCEGETYHIHASGYEKDLPEISAQSLFQYYEKMLEEDEMDLYIVGDFAMDDMKERVLSTFKDSRATKRNIVKLENDTPEQVEVKEIIEKQMVQQAKLHIGYRTNTTFADDDYFALHVFNGLFGGFPSSKLFINVREKESLAYYAASQIESHKGLLLVYSGIEAADFEKTRDIIALQMDEMKQGNFTEKEVDGIKELIVSDIRETLDHSQGIVELLYQQVIGNAQRLPAAFIAGINQVTRADVIRVAKKIKLDTIYVLTNRKEAEQGE